MLIMLIREAGLITFVAPDSKYWHCSHIRVDVYETKRDLKTGKIKAEERLTLALRYSQLMDRYEKFHTVQTCFLALLKNATD